MGFPYERAEKRINAKKRAQREADYRKKCARIMNAMRRGLYPSIWHACTAFKISVTTFEKYSE